MAKLTRYRSASDNFYSPSERTIQCESLANPDTASNTSNQPPSGSRSEFHYKTITNRQTDFTNRTTDTSGIMENQFPRIHPVSNSIITTEVEITQTFPLEISYLHSALFATVLEDTLIKLAILVKSGTQILINNLKQSMDEKWAKKFGVEPGPIKKDELSGVTYKNMHFEEFKLNKLDKDRAFFAEVIGSTYLDLALRLNFTKLKRYILGMQQVMNAYEFILEEEMRNRSIIKELRKQLRQQRVQNKTLIYDAMVKQDTLEKKIEDAEITAETGARQVEYWEGARQEQNLEKIRQTEEYYEDNITLFKDKQEQEQRVHAEIETFVTIATRDSMDQVEFWMAKYENDVEQIDLKLQIKRNYYLGMVEKREVIEEKIEEHNNKMEAWGQVKTNRKLEGEYRQKIIQSAIIVQAWWRGLLVRKRLGPYRPSKRRRMSVKLDKAAKKRT